MTAKLHLSQIRRSVSGTTITTTLCGRGRIIADGMNIADDPAKVTCAFCLKRMLRKAA